MLDEKGFEILADVSADETAKIKTSVETMFSLLPSVFYKWEHTMSVIKSTVHPWGSVSFTIYDQTNVKIQKLVAGFTLECFPNCRSVVVSTRVYVEPDFRGQHIGSELNKLRIRAMSLAGFERLLATVREDNKKEEHILKGNGWKLLSIFDSPNEGQVGLWERVL